jgi:hypothetical protein
MSLASILQQSTQEWKLYTQQYPRWYLDVLAPALESEESIPMDWRSIARCLQVPLGSKTRFLEKISGIAMLDPQIKIKMREEKATASHELGSQFLIMRLVESHLHACTITKKTESPYLPLMFKLLPLLDARINPTQPLLPTIDKYVGIKELNQTEKTIAWYVNGTNLFDAPKHLKKVIAHLQFEIAKYVASNSAMEKALDVCENIVFCTPCFKEKRPSSGNTTASVDDHTVINGMFYFLNRPDVPNTLERMLAYKLCTFLDEKTIHERAKWFNVPSEKVDRWHQQYMELHQYFQLAEDLQNIPKPRCDLTTSQYEREMLIKRITAYVEQQKLCVPQDIPPDALTFPP